MGYSDGLAYAQSSNDSWSMYIILYIPSETLSSWVVVKSGEVMKGL